MPELPEVETIVRELRSSGLAGQKIAKCIIKRPSLIRGRPLFGFIRQLTGRRIVSVERRGKFLVFTLSGGLFLFVHLRMSGQFDLVAARQPKDKHQHIFLLLDDGLELRYRDVRMFGRWQLTENPSEIICRLGPEPLAAAFKAKDLALILKGRRRQLKSLLLDQGAIAGIGNIYADEALWEAKLHPKRLSNSLNAAEIGVLYRAIRLVLRRGIRNKGTSLGAGAGNYRRLDTQRGKNQNSLRVSRQKGSYCPRCRRPLVKIKIGQRSTYFCPHCQKL